MQYCPSCGARFSQEAAFCPHDGVQTRELPQEPSSEDPLIGREIDGRYKVEAQIGEGGMGVVYLATHTVLGKKLALKVLRGEMARDAEVVQRFIQEAQTASSIGHSNIVDISDFGRLDDGSVYFVMEYLDGEPLTTFIARGGSVPMSEAIAIIEQMASAVGAAHARGVVHRDMKPDNVFILRRGGELVVKVLDFGIAKVGDANTKLTKTGMVFGTPHYMSPEQAAGHSVDGRTDLYAIGVIMYEMFTGHVPFDADTFMGILSKHMFEQPTPPSESTHGRQLGAIEDVILKALRKKPEERYQNMEELLADLSAVQAGGTVSVGGQGTGGSSRGLANALEPPSRTEMRLSRPDGLPVSKKAIGVMLAAAVVVFAAGLAGVVFALRSGDGADSASASGPVASGSTDRESPPPSESQSGDGSAEGAEAQDEGLPAGKEPPPPPAFVRITSEPSGAQVLIDGAMVGNTPAKLTRPEEGSTRVVLKHRGYEPGEVMLTSASSESITVTLDRATRRRRSPRRSSARRRPRSQPKNEPTQSDSEPKPEPKPEPRPEPMVTREVVDPWAE